MTTKLANNLNFLIANARISASELARRIELPAATIKKLRTGENSNPTIASLLPIAKFFNLTISQLIGEDLVKGYNINNLFTLPLISWEDSILWPTIKTQAKEIIMSEHSYSEDAYSLKIEEENWENFPKDGLLLIEPNIKAEHKDYIILHKVDQKIPTLKQLLNDTGTFYLKSVVSGYQMLKLSDEYKILGVACEYKKNLRHTINPTLKTKIKE